MELKLGDVVKMRKKHPCGSDEWEVVRLGADIGIKCRGCNRRLLLERQVFQRKVQKVVSRPSENIL
ncbi:MAG TPA: DUF951 domain-containing protein [Dehalococcoidia bacterium]|nr:DUF951 domain-containing protein [Dehalococcoidia bacterium]